MRAFPRPERIVYRVGNMLPDVTGEIDSGRPRRAQTERGVCGVLPRRMAAGTKPAGLPIVRE